MWRYFILGGCCHSTEVVLADGLSKEASSTDTKVPRFLLLVVYYLARTSVREVGTYLVNDLPPTHVITVGSLAQ